MEEGEDDSLCKVEAANEEEEEDSRFCLSGSTSGRKTHLRGKGGRGRGKKLFFEMDVFGERGERKEES